MTATPLQLGSPGPAPTIVPVASQATGGVTVEDITFAREGLASTKAFLVRPSGTPSSPAAAVLWFHWLEIGAPTSNRTEFLEEARSLAGRGVVSLLVDGSFPWHDRPSGIDHDVAAVETDARMLRAGLDLLAARPDVDASRIVLVGHDFGAMYASVVFGSDPRAMGLVMMAPTARWADWFLRYWPISDSRATYQAAMSPLDPVTWLAHANGRPILLQLAAHDQYVPGNVAAELTAAIGSSGEAKTYDAGHELGAAARADRDAWLEAHLGSQ
jgi:predicted esterase